MVKNTNDKPLTVVKRNIYNHDDSSKVFLLAILCPFILSFVLSAIANSLAESWEVKIEAVTSNIWFGVIGTVLLVAVYFAVWLGYNKTKDISFQAIRLNPKMQWHSYLILILVAVVVLFGFQYLVQAFDYFLAGVGYPLETGLGSIDPTGAGEYIYCVIAMALVPAVLEELIFRGVIFNGLREKFSSPWAILISAGLFALAHQNLQQIIYPLILGSVLAVVVLRTGSLFASMVVHFVNNFVVVTMSFVENLTGFSLTLPNTWWFYLVALGAAIVAGVICFIIDKFYFKHKTSQQVEKSKMPVSKYLYIAVAVGLFMFLLNVFLKVMSATQGA
ncbi:MAG: CPBP family intramembrane metalloprotease [Clostridiales bacterium]|nr:CPBP family intramembrane metalloprotease [Clostridiales bacterium]